MSFPVAKLHFILLQQELNGCSHQAAASTTRHKALGRSRFGFRAPKAENGCVLCQRKTEPANNKTSWCGRSVDRLNPDNRKWNGWISLNIHNSLISKLSGLLLLSWTTIDSPSISLCHYHLQTTKSSMQTALDITSHPKLLYKQHQFWKILLWICCLKSSWKHRIWPHCFNSHRSPPSFPLRFSLSFLESNFCQTHQQEEFPPKGITKIGEEWAIQWTFNLSGVWWWDARGSSSFFSPIEKNPRVSHLSSTRNAHLKIEGFFYLSFLHGSDWPEVRCKWQGRFVLPLFHLQYGLPLLLSRDALWGRPPCQNSCAGMGTQWLWWWGELLMNIWYTMRLEVGTNLPHWVRCTKFEHVESSVPTSFSLPINQHLCAQKYV